MNDNNYIVKDEKQNEYPWLYFWIGVVITAVFNGLTYMDFWGTGAYILVNLISIVFSIFSLVYAAFLYPSLFKENPRIKSRKVISFLNGFCGYILFGLCWQFNLKKNEKGVSHIVYIVLAGVFFALSIIGIMSYGLEALVPG